MYVVQISCILHDDTVVSDHLCCSLLYIVTLGYIRIYMYDIVYIYDYTYNIQLNSSRIVIKHH